MIRIRFLILVFVLINSVFAKEYYSVVKPLRSLEVKANVDGRVEVSNTDLEGTIGSKNRIVIQIDDAVEKKQLKNYKEQLSSYKQSLKNKKNLLKKQIGVYSMKNRNYHRYVTSKYRSRVQKDQEYYDVTSAYDNYYTTKENIETLKRNISDLEYQIFNLKEDIKDRRYEFNKLYIYKISVEKYDYVTKGTLIATVDDVSKAKILVFLDREDYKNISKKHIYINGKKTKYKIFKLQKIADSVNISSYSAEIIINKPKVFSNIVRVEFRYD